RTSSRGYRARVRHTGGPAPATARADSVRAIHGARLDGSPCWHPRPRDDPAARVAFMNDRRHAAVPSDGVILIAAAGWHDESPGGANKLPTDFARYLSRRGHRVVYLCASSAVDRITRSEVDGIDLRRY